MPHRPTSTATICAAAVLAALLTGCATIFHGSSEVVSFSSTPPGAKVYVNGQLMGTVPMEIKLIAKKSYTIEFRQEGYQTKTMILTNSVGGGWVVLDVVCGFVPVIVDAATGCWYSFDQDHVNGVLEPLPGGH